MSPPPFSARDRMHDRVAYRVDVIASLSIFEDHTAVIVGKNVFVSILVLIYWI